MEFYSTNATELLSDKFVEIINTKQNENLLSSNYLVVQDIMFAEYLEQGVLDKSEQKILANLDVFKLKQFIYKLYDDFLPEYEFAQFRAKALQWRIFKFLSALNSDAGLVDFAIADTDKKYFADFKDKTNSQSILGFSASLAKLFEDLQIYRGDWLEKWQKSEFEVNDFKNTFKPIDEDNKYLCILWRYLYAQIKAENTQSRSLSEINAQLINLLNSQLQPSQLDLLASKIVFAGINSLPIIYLQTIVALGRQTQVYLLMDNPSEQFWTQEKEFKYFVKNLLTKQKSQDFIENDFIDYLDNGNNLLLSWVKSKAEFLNILLEMGIDISDSNLESFAYDTTNILGQIQNQISEFKNLSTAKAEFGESLQENDTSLKFNICHTPMREVEVLQDSILKDLAENSDLQPRDILVITSDITTYAPIIKRVFARSVNNFKIPYYINDLYIKDSRDLVRNLIDFLEVWMQGRFTSYELSNFLNFPAMAARFEIEDVGVLKTYIEQSNIRWGLDSKNKKAIGIDGDNSEQILAKNTWSAGLDSMLLGFASDGPWADIQPLQSSFGKQSSLVGGLYIFIEKIIFYRDKFAEKRDYLAWHELIKAFIDDFYLPASKNDFSSLDFLKNSLDKWKENCELGSLGQSELSFSEFSLTWLDFLSLEKSRQHYFGNHVHFGEFVEGRNIPYKKIYILGMGDKKFPHSKRQADKFENIFYKYSRLGDKSRRSEDSNLFLQTLLSCRQSLTISWVGRSSSDDSELLPSVLVHQLQNYIEQIWGTKRLNALTKKHLLHGFDLTYTQEQNTTYSEFYADFYTQSNVKKLQLPKELDYSLASESISINKLKKYLESPITSFYKDYLKINTVDFSVIDLKETESFELDGLEKWKWQDSLLNKFEYLYEKSKAGEHINNYIQESINELFASGKIFESEITERYLLTTFIENGKSSLTKTFENYENLRANFTQQQISSALYTYEFDNKLLECKVPPIFVDKQGRLNLVFLSLKDLVIARDNKQFKNIADILETILTHLFISIFWQKIVNSDTKSECNFWLVAPKGIFQLPPLSSEQAQVILKGILQKYPKPLATTAKTGIGKLFGTSNDNLASVLEGVYKNAGELVYKEFLNLYFTSFADLKQTDFEKVSQDLYGDIFDQYIKITKQTKKGLQEWFQK